MDLQALADRLRRHVEILARTPHREPGSRWHKEAALYIQDQLERAGFAAHQDVFQLGTRGTGVNVSTDPFPVDDTLPLVIVGAHYDSKPDTPGADDNASGVAALLELAEWVGRGGVTPPPETGSARLQLVAYDLEEYGFVGSSVHAKLLRRAGAVVRGMISLEMLGYTDHRPGSQRLPPHLAALYPNVGNFIGVCGNEASNSMMQTVVAGLKSVPDLPVEFLAVPGTGEVLPETRLSDHSSFWDQGYPALMITDTAFFRSPHYHQPSDTPETLDYPFMAKVTSGVCEAVRRLVGPV